MSSELGIRLGAFLAVCLLMAAWERVAARRTLILPRTLRWPANLGILALDAALVRLIFSAAPYALALRAQAAGWGFLNAYPLPGWLKISLGVVFLDLVIYLQHVMFHAVPAFWRFHRMHHADLDFDFTTGGRFHPGEILLSVGIKMGAVAALGAPPLVFLLFEVLLNATAMFNHGTVSEERRQTLPWLLLLPFRGGAGRNPIGRSGNRGAEISQNPIGPMEEEQ